MSKGKRRKESAKKKREAKARRMQDAEGTSKYAQKRREQARGNYRPTSPFYLPLNEREA